MDSFSQPCTVICKCPVHCTRRHVCCTTLHAQLYNQALEHADFVLLLLWTYRNLTFLDYLHLPLTIPLHHSNFATSTFVNFSVPDFHNFLRFVLWLPFLNVLFIVYKNTCCTTLHAQLPSAEKLYTLLCRFLAFVH